MELGTPQPEPAATCCLVVVVVVGLTVVGVGDVVGVGVVGVLVLLVRQPDERALAAATVAVMVKDCLAAAVAVTAVVV